MPLSGTKVDRCDLTNMACDWMVPPDWHLVGFVVGWRLDSDRKKHIVNGDTGGIGFEVQF
jgi:hypothetical protein